MNPHEANVLIGVISRQRDEAMNALAQANAQLIILTDKLTELEKNLADALEKAQADTTN